MRLAQYFNRIIDSKVFRNFCYLILIQGGGYITPLLLIPYLVETIGLHKYGMLNIALSICFYAQVINEWGFDLSSVPQVQAHKQDPKNLSRIVSAILQARFLLWIFTSIGLVILVLSTQYFEQSRCLYLIFLCRLLGAAIAPHWLFKALEDLRHLMPITLGVKVFCLLPIFAVVNSESDTPWVAFFFSLESIVAAFISLKIVQTRYGLSYTLCSMSDILRELHYSSKYFFSTVLSRAYQTTSLPIVGFILGDSAAGLFSVAEKLHNAYIALVMPTLTNILYPYFTRSQKWQKINSICLRIICLNLLVALGMYLLSPHLLGYLFPSHADQIFPYFAGFIGILCISIPNELLGFPYLGALGKANRVLESTFVAAIIYFFLLAVLDLYKLISIPYILLCLSIAYLTSLLMRSYRVYQLILSRK